jgi:hypothetical protein
MRIAPDLSPFTALLLILTTVPQSGAQASAHGRQAMSAMECPSEILNFARAHVVAKFGEPFFRDYMVLETCRYQPNSDRAVAESLLATENPATPRAVPVRFEGPKGPHWSVSYRLRMESRPWVDGLVSLSVDSTGSVVSPTGIYGVCDCVKRPASCDFSVTESTAVAAAKRAGLEPGLRPWSARFQWVAGLDEPRFAWVIQNTTKLSEDGWTGSGRMLTIDAATAEVIGKFHIQWGP